METQLVEIYIASTAKGFLKAFVAPNGAAKDLLLHVVDESRLHYTRPVKASSILERSSGVKLLSHRVLGHQATQEELS